MEKVNFKKIFKSGKNNIRKNILIIGSGRWSKEITKEININFPKVKIFVFTNHKRQFKSWNSNNLINNVFFLSKKKQLDNIDCNFAIIANKNEFHYKYCEILLNKKYNVLVEKPLFLNQNKFEKLIKLSRINKKNIFLSMQYTFADYFAYVAKKINFKNIKNINFTWHDKEKELRNNLLKKHDQKVDFILDIFFHIYSILVKINQNHDFKYFKRNYKPKKNEELKFGNKNCEVRVNCTRNGRTRKRNLELISKCGIKFKIDFSNDLNLIFKINNRLILIPKKFSDTTLKYQIFFFLRNKQNVINDNKIKNLRKLFQYIEIIKKI